MEEQKEYYSYEDIFFSVIVPIYQVKEYLKESIESIIKQNTDSCEIILVDDGSTDGSAELCDVFAAENGYVRIIHQENAGLSAARNTGIKAASGIYIVLLDGDDKLCINALNSLYDHLIMNNYPDVAAHRRMAFDDDGNTEDYPYLYGDYIDSYNSNAEAFMKFQNMPIGNMGAWNFTVKREYIIEKDLFFYEGICHEDEEWVPRILLSGGRLSFSDIVFYGYRRDRAGSITKTLNIKRLYDKLFIAEHLQYIFSDSDEETRKSITYRCCSLVFGTICQMGEYKQIEGYHELSSVVKEKIQLLKKSTKKIHRMAYFGIKAIGLNYMVNFLYFLSKEQRGQK